MGFTYEDRARCRVATGKWGPSFAVVLYFFLKYTKTRGTPTQQRIAV